MKRKRQKTTSATTNGAPGRGRRSSFDGDDAAVLAATIGPAAVESTPRYLQVGDGYTAVLIITGYLDDRTTTDMARRIAATLRRATLVEMRNEGHDARPTGCHMSLMARFITNPAQPVDTSCVATVTPIRFVTTWAEATSGGAP